MRLLLDTHVLPWALAEPEKLSELATRLLQDGQSEVWTSSISLFEIATKVRLGKLPVIGTLLKQWEWTLSRLGSRLLQLNGHHAVRAGAWEIAHKDPFDRLLAAQALEEDLELLSSDTAFQQFPGLRVLW